MTNGTPPADPLQSFPSQGCAVVVGATGGIGAAVLARLGELEKFATVHGFGRSTDPPLDVLDEDSIGTATETIARTGPLRLVVDCTGFLHGEGWSPEKTYRHLDPAHLAHAFAVNATGPALLMKHLLPLFPRQGKAVFATLSAKVGSIGDNRFGGWYAYRASKAALNQIVRTSAIELSRRRPESICVALHPGTTDTPLSAPFGKDGLTVRTPDEAAAMLLAVLDDLTPSQSGAFLDYNGATLPW